MKNVLLRGRTARLLGLACLAAVAPFAAADTSYDLTTAGSSAVINGATFGTTDTQPTGSGFIHSFVRISTNDPIVQGFNTDARPLQFDENNSATFTHSILISNLGPVTVSGTEYFEFLLDINQNKSGTDSLLSLNEVKIYAGNAPDLTANTTGSGDFDGFGTNAVLLYDMDAGDNATVELEYNLNSGSGSGDMYLLVPTSLFTSAIVSANPYLYLWSSLGDPNANNDGYEEWAAVTGQFIPPPPPGEGVPLPGIAWAGMALFGGFGVGRRRRA